ncbi:hypothetical protein ACP275_14G102600 [Erythranthe tilingii]
MAQNKTINAFQLILLVVSISSALILCDEDYGNQEVRMIDWGYIPNCMIPFMGDDIDCFEDLKFSGRFPDQVGSVSRTCCARLLPVEQYCWKELYPKKPWYPAMLRRICSIWNIQQTRSPSPSPLQ